MRNDAEMEEAISMAEGAGINTGGRRGHEDAACGHP